MTYAYESASFNHIITLARWTEQEARGVLSGLAASGLGVAEFAARHSIQAQRIYLWRRKIAGGAKQLATTSPMFLEIGTHARSSTSRDTTRYELVTKHGDTLRIDGAIDAQAVRTLFEILRQGRPC